MAPQIIKDPGLGLAGVDFKYETSSCCCENRSDYCRCGRIIIDHIDRFDWGFLVEDFCPTATSSYDKFLVDRFLRRTISEENFEGIIRNGYYGEEFGGICFSSSSFETRRVEFNGLSQTERLLYVLHLEYGHLLPEIEEVKEWEVVEVNSNEIGAFDSLMQKVNSNAVLAYQTSRPEVVALCLRNSDGTYRLLDGRHRYSSVSPNSEIKILVPSETQPCEQSEESIRENALAKLTIQERKVLGV